MHGCDAHNAEYLAAIAGMPHHTVSPDRTIRLGRRVRVPKAFGCGHQEGTIACQDRDRHLGLLWLVDTPEGRLRMLPDEIEVI